MAENGSEFDFQMILVACEIQNQALDETSKRESKNVQQYKTQLETYKQKVKKFEENTLTYQKLILQRNELTQKLNQICKKKSIVDREVKDVQKLACDFYKKLGHESIEIVQVIKSKKKGLQNIFAQFEGDILQKLISECNAKLLTMNEITTKLLKQYNQLKNSPKHFEQHKGCISDLRNLFKDVPKREEIEIIEAEIKNLKEKSEINMKKIQDLKRKLQ